MLRHTQTNTQVSPDRSVSQAAGPMIDDRLKRVWRYAKLAAKCPDNKGVSVHQLRVYARRSYTSLQIFGGLLPRRRARWMKRRLRDLRRAAGEARNLDVLIQRLHSACVEQGASPLEAVIQQAIRQRLKAQKPLIKAYRKAKRQHFKKQYRALVASVRWRQQVAEPTFTQAANASLIPLVQGFLSDARADLSDIEALHRMRISGKRVRYAMELLAGAFPKRSRRELYQFFESVQDRLGRINDHATAMAMFDDWAQQSNRYTARHELRRLASVEQQQLEIEAHAFRIWWTPEREAELTRRFMELLGDAALKDADADPAMDMPPTSQPTVGRSALKEGLTPARM